jgi:excisionase family DNA binding protein
MTANRLLELDEVEECLSVSRTTLYRLVKRGDLPTVQIGRRRYVTVQDLDDYVNRLRAAR